MNDNFEDIKQIIIISSTEIKISVKPEVLNRNSEKRNYSMFSQLVFNAFNSCVQSSFHTKYGLYK